MNITYTGMPAEMLPKERAKLEAKLAKVLKLIERKGEKEVHVILSQVRHLNKVEITLNALDHSLVGVSSDADLATAMSGAIEKLEKQILKLLTKWRDTHRNHTNKETQPTEVTAPVAKAPITRKVAAKAAKVAAKAVTVPQVFRVNHKDGRKPMTLDEAMLELGSGQDYFVYRDANTDRVCTLMRRSDGHLDLIES